VLGATSLLNVVGKRKGALRDWIVGLLAKKPARLVTVALANKLARILWAMMKTGETDPASGHGRRGGGSPFSSLAVCFFCHTMQ
jgi:hypothetical protein